MRAILSKALLPIALLASATAASASETFPGHIQEKYGTECAPSCTLCHTTNKGGIGTASKPFAVSARTRGLSATSLSQLDLALDKMETDAVNSDGEAATDIQEIKQGDDPNTVGGDLCIGPKYGCGASTVARAASKRGLDPAATVASSLLIAFGLLLARRRRR